MKWPFEMVYEFVWSALWWIQVCWDLWWQSAIFNGVLRASWDWSLPIRRKKNIINRLLMLSVTCDIASDNFSYNLTCQDGYGHNNIWSSTQGLPKIESRSLPLTKSVLSVFTHVPLQIDSRLGFGVGFFFEDCQSKTIIRVLLFSNIFSLPTVSVENTVHCDWSEN